MKRNLFFCLFISIALVFIYSCGNITNTEKQNFRIIAWSSLSDELKGTVIHEVGEASVDFNATYRPFAKPGAEPVPAVSVTFNTEYDALLGPIVVYIDRETKEILGRGARF